MSEVSVACGARICVRVVTGSNNKAATDAAMLQLEPAVMCCVWIDLVNKHGVNCPPPQTPARLLDKLVRS
eukprot:scaffold91978_cov16-Tisochrysis_lutea.AAC.1